MAEPEHLDTHHKALSINLDPKIFGSFAEIGAGQEVARWFLRVGAASGTVAKTISAYDKKVSDDVYGTGTRYVSRERLEAMLDREWEHLLRQLAASRESSACLFVFADTVTARNFAGTNECHGWMGLRFQTRPGGAAHDVVLHVNLMDGANLAQHEALGILGVNLVHAAFFRRESTERFLAALFDDLALGRIEIDLAAFRGPELDGIDPRLPLVELVRTGRAEAVAFPADGRLVPPTEVLHGRPVLLEPGQFATTHAVSRTMLAAALAQLRTEVHSDTRPRLPSSRCRCGRGSTARRRSPRRTSYAASTTCTQRNMAFSSFVPRALPHERARDTFHRVADPLRDGVSTLVEIFQDRGNDGLAGALLEALARLFARNVRIYAYPMRADVLADRLATSSLTPWIGAADGADLIAADHLRPAPPFGHLYAYLIDTGFIVSLRPAVGG